MSGERARRGVADEPPPAPRPALVELAAAILIVGGVVQLVSAIGSAGFLPAGTELLFIVAVALDVATIAAGLLVRSGRLWLLVVNYVAVLGFIDLSAAGGSIVSLALGLADVAVVVILIANRPWFDQRRAAPDRDELNP